MRALFMKLFQWRSCWEEFINECWPEAYKPTGQKACKKYGQLAQKIFQEHLGTQKLLRGQSARCLAIPLSVEQMAKLEKMASECCVDAPTPGKIWIIEHLR
jgi:hypothetical protein